MTDAFDKKTDEELVELSLHNKELFLHLMNRYEKRLYSYIYRISSARREDAQDILQDVFIKTYTNLHGFSQQKKFSSWIYRITHNETISHFRRKKARPSIPLEENDLTNIASKLNIEVNTDAKLTANHVQSIINKLKPKYKDVLILRYLEEKSYEEIGDILKKPSGTVATLINRAKKCFQKAYGQKN